MEQDKYPLLTVSHLAIDFETRYGVVRAVEDVSFTLNKGEVLALVGESGSGKSITAYSILNLLDTNGRLAEGKINYHGMALHNADKKMLSEVRGREIAMIFQNPMSTLNPIRKVGEHLSDMLRTHGYPSFSTISEEITKLLHQVEIYDVERVRNAYPFELSGGMCQRVMIALALACKSRVLIADEPTTALDVTIQAQIMALLNDLKKEFNTAIIMITHDLGVVAGSCDKVLVMYAGRTMEYGTVDEIFYKPSHPYTEGLLKSIPRLDGNDDVLATIPGNPPNLLNLPVGCPYQERCDRVMDRCKKEAPMLTAFADNRSRACFSEWESW